MRRKGELSPTRIDRDWPHQIVLKANDCLGQNDSAKRTCCADPDLVSAGMHLFKSLFSSKEAASRALGYQRRYVFSCSAHAVEYKLAGSVEQVAHGRVVSARNEGEQQ